MPLTSSFTSLASHTKKSLVATERRRAKIKKQREDWFRHRVPAVSVQPERVAFIDETSVKTNLTRQRGWSPRGDRLVMDGSAFAAYVEKVLVPELEPGTVVILDNLATQKNAVAAKAMRDAGCWFLFLPPYSPDVNPIEIAFSKLKAHLRRIGARSFNDMFDAIAQICDLLSPEEC